jgi:uroporphyrin-III C-methyltransferase / precorrin-2 dehydrogenase / sirohydrochlorin ferrochelatase
VINSLPLFHRIAGKPVIVLGEGDAAEAKRRLVERAGGVVRGEEDGQARLAFVALAEPEAAVERLRARGLLVNVPDRPELCDFTVPSVLDRNPVLVAIGTGGASAGLAKALRLRLETLLPASLGALTEALGSARAALRRKWPDADDRRLALDVALAAGGPLDPLGEADADAVLEWLNGGSQAIVDSREIILTSDDFEDLTLRQLRLLGSADLIAHESAVPAEVLDRARADARRIPLEPGAAAPAGRGLTVVVRRA